MAETTIGGVSLYSKERGKNTDIFDLALTYQGIEIRRPGEEPRFLSWERITEWEIEQRRGGVLLVLRGSGSVTPLSIPRWKVDDLDLVLRDVTTHWSEAVAQRAAGQGVRIVEVEDEAAVLAHEFEPEPVVTAEAVLAEEPVRMVETEPEPEPVVVAEPEPAPAPAPETVKAKEPVVDRDLGWRPTVAPHELESDAVMEAGITSAEASDAPVAGKLVWPNRSSLDAVPDLAWPSDTPPESAPADPSLVWSADAAPKPKVRVIESTPEPVPVAPVMPEPAMKAADPKVVIRPVEGAPERPVPVTARATRAARRTSMQTNHQQPRRRSTAQMAFTVSLLGVLAASVALVLAQSAGAVHLSFLGFAG